MANYKRPQGGIRTAVTLDLDRYYAVDAWVDEDEVNVTIDSSVFDAEPGEVAEGHASLHLLLCGQPAAVQSFVRQLTEAAAAPLAEVLSRLGVDPVCRVCGMAGTEVETITDMVVWHHVDAEVEDEHDFEPTDGRSTVLYDPEVHGPGLRSVDPPPRNADVNPHVAPIEPICCSFHYPAGGINEAQSDADAATLRGES